MSIPPDVRALELHNWVQRFYPCCEMKPIPGDASTRRYFRVLSFDKSYIAVDAPPATEKNQAFVSIANSYIKQGLHAPLVHQYDLNLGFLLLSDLGDIQLLKVLDTSNVYFHYQKALEELIKLQRCEFEEWVLPVFDRELLLMELNRFHDWYLIKHLGLELSAAEMAMLNNMYNLLIASAEEQPQVSVHRDYHSRNLMLLPGNELGILDFQDAVLGPITYDLVSLVRDCYINWPTEQVYGWVEQFWRLLKEHKHLQVPLATFNQWFDWMGLQRHLKVLGIFARLYLRDNKPMYLKDVPRILEYVWFVCHKYEQFSPLKEFIITRVITHESNDFSGWSWQSNAPVDGSHA